MRNSWKWIQKQTRKWLLHPICPAVVTLFLLTTGGVGSIYSPEIRNAFPFHLKANGPISWPSVLFWGLAIISSLAFFFRQQVEDQERQKNQGELVSNAETLTKLIRTMPPANFLSTFASLYNEAERVYELAYSQEEPDVKALEESIRVLLRITATLAQQFDGDFPNIRYAANIMLFKSSHDLKDEQKVRIRKLLMFCEDTVSIDRLRGVLVLKTELSTTASDEEAQRDPNLQEFALPLPPNPKTNDRYKILPGAPIAFESQEPSIFVDTAAIRGWCEEQGDFTEEVIRIVETYFTEHEDTIRSFISIPLVQYASTGTKCLGVLNIHSNRPGMLKDSGDPIIHFVSIICPIQSLLRKMISDYSKKCCD